MDFPKWALVMVLSSAWAVAQDDIYLCINDKGMKEYRNTDITKNCKKVPLPAGTSVPAPASAHKPAPAPAQAGSAAGDFSRVDGAMQKTRDAERRQILLDELQREERRQTELREAFNNGEPERSGDERNYAKYQERVAAMKAELARSEKNIEALKREMSSVK